MTTIVVASTPTQCVIASESGITDEAFVTAPPMRKIVQQNEWLIASSGADRVCDVLQYMVKYPAIPPNLKNKDNDLDWYQWIAKRIIPIIRKAAQDELTLDTKDGVAELPDSELILVTHGRAFSISNTLGISSASPYWAIGSGGSLALGALSVLYNVSTWDTEHETYCHKAIQTAIKHDSFSHPPIYGYISNKNGKIKQWDSTDLA